MTHDILVCEMRHSDAFAKVVKWARSLRYGYAWTDTAFYLFRGNGTTIIVPKNTLLQMPAFALTWQELFAMAPKPYGPTQSGLAAADVPRPATTYEIRVQGNRIGSPGSEQFPLSTPDTTWQPPSEQETRADRHQ